jgi:cytochrome oxidase assembly protein ShyY1
VKRKIIPATAVGLALFFGCIQGALWQFERHKVRDASNQLIRNNVANQVPLKEGEISLLSKSEITWRQIQMRGNFLPDYELLARNRYHEGKYGFGVITLFQSEAGKLYWVDRGWVQAGKDASTAPRVEKVDLRFLTITARIRIESVESQISGSLFATPQSSGSSTLSTWNQEESIVSEPIYLTLISASDERFTPAVATALPSIGMGPHLAYTFQWIIFAGLVILAWVLIYREEKLVKEELPLM